MGRSKGLNKSELIREYLREYPGCRTKDVVEHFRVQGVEVSQQLVSCVRSKEGIGSGVLSEVRLSELKSVKDFVGKSELDPSVAVGILGSFCDLVDLIGGIARFRRVLSEYTTYLNGQQGSVDPLESESDSDSDEDHEEDRGGGSWVDPNEEDDD